MSSAVRAIQTTLKEAGFYTGDIDGIAGALTLKAVEQAVKAKVCTHDEQTIVAEQNANHPEYTETLTTEQVVSPVKVKYHLGEASKNNLKGVKTPLQRVVELAITKTNQDFKVVEGLRTKERQRQLLRQGATQTMNSKHLTGDAVDIYPLVNGKVSYDWKYFYEVARAMRESAEELGIKIIWGGCWQVLNGTTTTTESLVQAYGERKRKNKQKAFTDGPHYELA